MRKWGGSANKETSLVGAGRMSGLPKVVPPLRFGIVEVGVYRGAYPTLFNFPFLKTLSLRTIISLVPENPTPDLEDFCTVRIMPLRCPYRRLGEKVPVRQFFIVQKAQQPPSLHPQAEPWKPKNENGQNAGGGRAAAALHGREAQGRPHGFHEGIVSLFPEPENGFYEGIGRLLHEPENRKSKPENITRTPKP